MNQALRAYIWLEAAVILSLLTSVTGLPELKE